MHRLIHRLKIITGIVGLPWLIMAATSTWGAEPIRFARDVAPILQQRCLRCHHDRDRRGGLSLQSAQSTRRGGASGPVIEPGDPDSSYLIELLTDEGEGAEMPQGQPPLSDRELTILRRWIAAGAVWPEQQVLTPPQLWSLRPLVTPPLPPIAESKPFPISNPIDLFIARRHHEAGVRPAPLADRRTLIRRLFLDLTGLPPSSSEVQAFVEDVRPLAYERLVDKLLSSPHFGEHWGRYWLDLARYADSEGYLGDALRPHAWVYREWVLAAINRDQPFDQFTIEQLAGDLLDKPTLAQKIATGFHRNTLRNTEAGVDLELYRTKEIVDRVNTTGMVWLGLTLGCAECHDHKHDPISQKEFYQIYAFFNNADEIGVPATQAWEWDEYRRDLHDWQPVWQELVAKLATFEAPNVTAAQQKTISKTFSEPSSTIDWKTLSGAYRTTEPGWEDLKSTVDAHLLARPTTPNTKARAFAKRTKNRRDTFVHVRGVYQRHGAQVHPETPAILPAISAHQQEPDRLDLARWLFHRDNPLTPRVAVNRIWKHLFGQGIVTTPNDFGHQGAQPTHPRLLDWLATEYRNSGWSRKAVIRLIVNSSTYRLSSAPQSIPSQADRSNLLLWRQNSYRVNAEVVRDLHLAASGLLNRSIGRRGIRPPLPPFVTEVGRSVKWPVSTGGEQYRRGLYIFFKRTVPYPMLMTFDAPDSTLSCSRRERTNTPLQALTLLNDPVFFECAQSLGGLAHAQHPDDASAARRAIFEQCLSRQPTPQESQLLESAYRDFRQLEQRVIQREAADGTESETSSEVAALILVARIVMNLDEFITRD